MNIVFVSKECPPSPRSSGIGTYVWETGKALASMGHRITIIAAADDGNLTTVHPAENLTVIRLPDDEIDIGQRNIVVRTLRGPIREGMAYRTRVAECLNSLIAQGHVDIVEFCGFRGESYIWLNKPREVPMIVRMHGFTAGLDTGWKKRLSASGRCLNKWETREVLAADLITAVSENQAESVRKRFGADRTRVIHNSIDTAWWRQLAADAPMGLHPDDILYAGGLAAKKGIFYLLEAASELRKQGWNGRLVVAGRAYRDFDRYLAKLKATGTSVPPWVSLLGSCPREQLAGFYRDAGAACFPSLQDPFPYTCMEAMTCGAVTIGTSGTGMAEMLTPSTGFVVSPANTASLVSALSAALHLEPAARETMRLEAQQHTAKNFDHSVVLPRLIALYSGVIAKFQSAHPRRKGE